MPTNTEVTRSKTLECGACSRKFIEDILGAAEKVMPAARQVMTWPFPFAYELFRERAQEVTRILAMSIAAGSRQYQRNRCVGCRPATRRRAVRRRGGGGRGGGRGGDGPGGDGPGGDSAPPILSHLGSNPHPGVAGRLGCETSATDDRGNASRRRPGSALCEMAPPCGYGAGSPRPMDGARAPARPGRHGPLLALCSRFHGMVTSLPSNHGGVSCRAS